MTSSLTLTLASIVLLLGTQANAAPLSPRQEQSFGHVPSTVGQLSVQWGNGDYTICSGVVVNTPTKNIVATAAHCLYDPKISEHDGYPVMATFTPQADWGKSPHGKWWMRGMVKMPQYKGDGDWTYDQGFMIFAPQDGRELVDAVGGSRLAWGWSPATKDVTAWGYPGGDKYKANRAVKCQDKGAEYLYDSRRSELPCEMGGGSSGGPWFDGLLEGDDQGTVFALTSTAGGPESNHHIQSTPISKEFFDLVYGYTD